MARARVSNRPKVKVRMGRAKAKVKDRGKAKGRDKAKAQGRDKVSNLANMVRAAKHDVFVVSDSDAFVLELDALGRHLWSKRFGDASAQLASRVAIDAAGKDRKSVV